MNMLLYLDIYWSNIKVIHLLTYLLTYSTYCTYLLTSLIIDLICLYNRLQIAAVYG